MKVFVTPKMATEWLAANTRNRKLNQHLVTEYARDMESGRWAYNGEAIKIGDNGRLLDGQHRLAAVIASGTEGIWMEVIKDLPAETQDTMDIGRKRNVGDMLALDGETYPNNLAAVARKVWQWDQNNNRFNRTPSPSPAEIRETIQKYPHLRRSAELGHRIGRTFPPARPAVIGVAHHLFHQIDQNDAALFLAQLETGADLSEGHPVLALRLRFTQDKVMQRTTPFHVGVGACIRAWNAVRKGENLTIVKMTSGHEMPKPL